MFLFLLHIRSIAVLANRSSSRCLAVTPGKDEKDGDESCDWGCNVATNLCMAVLRTQTAQSAWLPKDETLSLPTTREGRRMKLAS